MSAERLRLLVAADFHVGRHPSRVPTDAPGLDVASVVRALVEAAVERRVDAVLLAGDLADEGNKFYEAFGVLQAGLRRLADAGIATFAVAGNHDHDVAGALADAVGSPLVRVLGRGGRWETAEITRAGRPVARVAGWSFPARHHDACPLDGFADVLDASDGLPLVGLLHADVGGPADSRYAPVELADLMATPAALWAVGHVHVPRVLCDAEDGRPMVLVPGSPQPLDPGETGAHGAWLVTLGDDGRAEAEMLPLATVRYDRLDVSLDGADRPEAARSAILEAVTQHARAVRDESPGVRYLALRLHLTGRAAVFSHAAALAGELADEDGGRLLDLDGLSVAAERVTHALRPPLDLDRLADGAGPVATLARRARRFDEGALDETDRALVARTVVALREARAARVFEPLGADGRFGDDVEAEAMRRLHRQTLRLLDAALAQLPTDGPAPDSPDAAA